MAFKNSTNRIWISIFGGKYLNIRIYSNIRLITDWHPLEENRVNIQTWFIFKDLNDDLSPKFIISYNGLRVIFLLLQCIMFHPSCLIIVLSVLYHQNQTLKPNQRHETRNAPDMVSDTDTPSTNNKQQTIWHDQRPIKSPL